MSNAYVFQPARRVGLIFQVGLILLLAALGTLCLVQAARATIGPTFLLYLFLALFAFSLIPVIAYRAFALFRAYYVLERDGLRVHWGLRAEMIPMDNVLWIRRASELDHLPPLPWLRWPGSVLGARRLAEGGEVEFLASSTDLVLIATPSTLFAISPADPVEFLNIYHRFTELGTLTPLPADSIYPSFLLARVWADPAARYLLLSSLAFNLALLVWVSLAIPTRSQVALGFTPGGAPRDLIPAIRLLLLPVLNGAIFLIDFLLGLFFYRSEDNKILATLLWGSSALTALLFLASVFFILEYG